jgi:transketolase
MLSRADLTELIEKSYRNRITLVEMLIHSGVGHIGGAFSAMDMFTVLYEKILRHDPKNPRWSDRDIFILSAGHKAVGLYIVLQSVGYFGKEVLGTHNALGTPLPMHPDDKLLPGIEFPTGALGHGLSVACGIATAWKMDGSRRRMFVMLGDGESNEGSVWEAMLSAMKQGLDNLTAIVDCNGVQGCGPTKEIMPIASLESVYRDVGWSVRTINGHDMAQIHAALLEAPYQAGRPTCIIANTVKGKGIDFAENDWHYHHWVPNAEDGARAIESLKHCHQREVLSLA